MTVEASAKLFGFLYGQTLLEVKEAAADSLGCDFEIEPGLLQTGRMVRSSKPSRKQRRAIRQRTTAGILIPGHRCSSRSTSDSKTPLIRFRWSPRRVAGLRVVRPAVVAGGARGRIVGPRSGGWAAKSLHVWEAVEPLETPAEGGLTAALGETRPRSHGDPRLDGISSPAGLG